MKKELITMLVLRAFEEERRRRIKNAQEKVSWNYDSLFMSIKNAYYENKRSDKVGLTPDLVCEFESELKKLKKDHIKSCSKRISSAIAKEKKKWFKLYRKMKFSCTGFENQSEMDSMLINIMFEPDSYKILKFIMSMCDGGQKYLIVIERLRDSKEAKSQAVDYEKYESYRLVGSVENRYCISFFEDYGNPESKTKKIAVFVYGK